MGRDFQFTYIIPIHVKDPLVFNALNSLIGFKNTKVIISCTEEVQKWFETQVREEADRPEEIIITSKNSSYASLVNAGIKHSQTLEDWVTDFISILEFDDAVIKNAHETLRPWLNNEADILSPLAAMVTGTVPVNGETPKLNMIAMLNEAPLATGLADEYGVLDIQMLLKANFAFVNGMYIRPKVFTEYGIFKENFEILTDYEWILRMIYLGVESITIPKIIRYHFYREESEFHRQKNLPPEYREKWLNLVIREYLFSEDREITD